MLLRLWFALMLAMLAVGATPADAAPSHASTPAVHALADEPPGDSDGDGITDDQDQCPNDSGVAENYGCPYFGPVDSDGDGVTDDQDACPSDAGSAAYQGCPAPDSDSDGIADDTDACPYQAGPYDGCPLTDYDGDGVYDDGTDQCPNEAGPASNNGCPLPDSDADDVTDDVDSCPGTVAGAEVDGAGCSAAQRDSDGDGVNDAVDQCPSAPGPASNNGCPLPEVTAGPVTFSDRCGTRNDTVTVPRTRNVTYLYKSRRIAPGRYAARGTITIKARAAKGYTLTGTSTWTKTFSATPRCRVR